jgi:hypothetical protein
MKSYLGFLAWWLFCILIYMFATASTIKRAGDPTLVPPDPFVWIHLK